MLKEMLESENPPSVGIITPHTEQSALLSSLVVRHPLGEQFDDVLKLKIMTFDSCQGEERDVIVYSMVATRERDVLNHIFPVELKSDDDENDNMKAQRLNVGFSRAKEAMVFVLSKAPEEYRGTIGQALMHYKRILTERVVAEDTDTDARSPMEKKLLSWLKATSFMQMEAERLELMAQFPIGDYLKQLDATYKHPAYKVDFLLRHFNSVSGKVTNVIIEYDGFLEHFTGGSKVTGSNYEWYYRPDDVERQFVLESYGYRFLRVNRFNLSEDPVHTLDQRLREMVDVRDPHGSGGMPDGAGDASAVDKIKEQARALGEKEARKCRTCNEVKDNSAFFDKNLGSGKGGFGRICVSCKDQKATAESESGSSDRFSPTYTARRRWRGYRR
jgi:hypothetical protein